MTKHLTATLSMILASQLMVPALAYDTYACSKDSALVSQHGKNYLRWAKAYNQCLEDTNSIATGYGNKACTSYYQKMDSAQGKQQQARVNQARSCN